MARNLRRGRSVPSNGTVQEAAVQIARIGGALRPLRFSPVLRNSVCRLCVLIVHLATIPDTCQDWT